MAEVAAEAVELPDDEHVALPQGPQAVCRVPAGRRGRRRRRFDVRRCRQCPATPAPGGHARLRSVCGRTRLCRGCRRLRGWRIGEIELRIICW